MPKSSTSKFAYATNGKEIIEFDFLTGIERKIDKFPSPAELWSRLCKGQKFTDEKAASQLLSPCHHQPGKQLRYYQEIAVHRVIQAILKGQRRILLTMATGTGKTLVAFQICWKLWNALWNRTGEHRRPKILYLADRNILIDDPKDKTFAPFGDARWKITGGKISKGREIYFAIYQALAEDENRPGLFREYPSDFFDLIIIDECHRGSARDESSWREILDYFKPAFQLGLTATPKRKDNVNTYAYFGNPIYTYSPAGRELTTGSSLPIGFTGSSRPTMLPAGGPPRVNLIATEKKSQTKNTRPRISSGRWLS